MNWNQLENYPSTWKWIWLISLALYALTIVNYIFGASIDLGIIISGLIVVSLYGLGYEKPIWSLKLWKGLFWFMSIFIVLTLTLFLFGTEKSISTTEVTELPSHISLISNVLSIGFFFFFLIELRGLYLYAYKRPQIWHRNNELNQQA